jgi:hypothetical protein
VATSGTVPVATIALNVASVATSNRYLSVAAGPVCVASITLNVGRVGVTAFASGCAGAGGWMTSCGPMLNVSGDVTVPGLLLAAVFTRQ